MGQLVSPEKRRSARVVEERSEVTMVSPERQNRGVDRAPTEM